jgi:cysteine-rich repeat protein
MRSGFLLAVLAAVAACDPPTIPPDNQPPDGAEGGACYGNGSCDDGLTCASNTCVALPAEGEGEGEPAPLVGVVANVSPLLASDECPAGGVDVSTGIDVNASGQLEADEVTRVVTICNGSDGANALAETTAFDASEGCPSGGVRVTAGVDRDGDDVLDAEEVLRTDELCHGAGGASGLTTRVVLTAIDPGTPCAAGGTRIESGLDLDGDGALSAAEIQQQATVCHGEPGPAGTSCTVERDDVAGTTTITCEDGTEAVVRDGDTGTPGEPGEPGTDGLQTLARLEPELEGPHCPFGGTRVLVGVDDNDDGTLQGDAPGELEVDDVAYVCHGEPGPATCSAVRDDVAGTTTITCEDGTEAVIHDGETGTQGEPGADARQTLVRLEPELGGPLCPYSGTQILVGIDDNGDGVLQGDAPGNLEVDDVATICSSEPGPCANGFVDEAVSGRCLIPACGDGILTTDEQCDDGDGAGGDGCDSDCAVEDGFTCVGQGAGSCTGLGCGVVDQCLGVVIPCPAPACVPAPTGLVSWWRAEGDASDSVGANNGTFSRETYGSCLVGGSFLMDGISSQVSIPASSSLSPIDDFSIESWIRKTEDRDGAILSRWGDFGSWDNQRAYELTTLSGGRIHFVIAAPNQPNDGLSNFDTAPGSVSLNEWHHIVGTYQKSLGLKKIYVNGILIATHTDPSVSVKDSIANITIGASERFPGGFFYHFPGEIDEVSFYSRALIDNEISALAAAGRSGKCH